MSDALLSNDEVADLVAAVKEGSPVPQHAAQAHSRRIRVVDFTMPTRFTSNQRRRIERAHDSFCRSAAVILTAEVGLAIELEVIDLTQLTYGAALDETPVESIFASVHLSELSTRMLLIADRQAVAEIVDRMLGGRGGAHSAMTAPMPSEIERTVISRFLTLLLSQLSPPWQELAGTSLELGDIDVKRANLEIAAPTEAALALTFELRLDGTPSTLSLVIPYQAIEGVADVVGNGPDSGDGPWHADAHSEIGSNLLDVEVEVSVEVASVQLSLDEVLGLGAGELLNLNIPEKSTVRLAVGEVPLQRCRLGRSGDRRAVEVLAPGEAA